MIADLNNTEARGNWLVTPAEIAADEARAVAVQTAAPAVPARVANIIAPLRDVPGYLAVRKAAAHFSQFEQEEALFVTLPSAVREELTALLGRFPGGGAFGKVIELMHGEKLKVHPACARVLRIYAVWQWSLPRFRARFDAWTKTQDWVVLVNRARAGLAWQTFKPGTRRGLPEAFLQFVAARVGEFKRGDGLRQALFSIHRQWRTGLNHRDEVEAIPGYGFWPEWFALNFPGQPEPKEAPIPQGWGYDNLRVLLRKRMPKAVRALLLEGSAAAKPFLPGVLRSRAQLRFMEEVTFDDVKLDYRVLDPQTGEVCDMWILLARCTGTATALGFVQRPARVREDGSQEHLNLRDMKQLVGLTLEKYGLPPYLSTWKLERGTATLNEGQAAALQELLPDAIRFSFNSMLGGKSAAGYREKGKGNSAAKASHESHNRLIHTMSAGLPGQTGPLYTRRPADLAAREAEASATWTTLQLLPEELRGQAQYPILTIAQSRQHLFNVLHWMNARTEHRLEGFDDVVEFYDPGVGVWRHQAQLPDDVDPTQLQIRTRKESPFERAAKLIRASLAAGEQFRRVSPDIIAAFFQHSQRFVVVQADGEIRVDHEKRALRFRPLGVALTAGTKLLAHFNEEEPDCLYCTDGRGAIAGLWVRRDRSRNHDELIEQLRYTQSALGAAREQADALGAQERERLEAMRAHNAALLGENSYVQVTAPQAATTLLTSGVATAMNGLTTSTKQLAADQKKRAKQLAEFDGEVSELAEVKPTTPEGNEDFSPEGLL